MGIGWKKISKKRLTLAAILLLAIAITMATKLLNSPSEGVISYPKSSNGSPMNMNNNFVRYDGDNVSFSYPEGFRFDKRQGQPPSVLESYFLVAPAQSRNPSYTIGVSVYRLPTGGINEDGNYRIRNNAPLTYKKTTKTVNGRQVIYFENKQKPENTAFIQNGNLVVAIGLSGSVLGEGAMSAFSHLVESLSWF